LDLLQKKKHDNAGKVSAVIIGSCQPFNKNRERRAKEEQNDSEIRSPNWPLETLYMEEHVGLLKEQGIPIPKENSDPKIIIQNQENLARAS
jgi:hypothetical protein